MIGFDTTPVARRGEDKDKALIDALQQYLLLLESHFKWVSITVL